MGIEHDERRRECRCSTYLGRRPPARRFDRAQGATGLTFETGDLPRGSTSQTHFLLLIPLAVLGQEPRSTCSLQLTARVFMLW
jgi:hypothetical protein